MDIFKRILQKGLMTISQLRMLLFLEASCSAKVSPRISSLLLLKCFTQRQFRYLCIISLLFRCVEHSKKWAFKRKVSLSFAGESSFLVNYDVVCRQQWKPGYHMSWSQLK